MATIEGFEELSDHARWLGKSWRTVLRYCDEPGGLPHTYVGRTRLFKREWTLEWIEGNRRQRNPTPKRRRAA